MILEHIAGLVCRNLGKQQLYKQLTHCTKTVLFLLASISIQVLKRSEVEVQQQAYFWSITSFHLRRLRQ